MPLVPLAPDDSAAIPAATWDGVLVVKVVALVLNAPDKPPGAAPPAVTPALAGVVVVP
ncbi:hypothetical protein [Halomonas sp. GD1P12]|uniref:hypothetical protein n=1 Tax=Halomonas sp. GD1P12 TaxID=2982691 RepID=UPI0021E4D147|nr:hypothetical protein [Halomonas sp. GD1P12]UYF99278.1 hypothetical protein OCT39_13725 [Halomonas sp. GD1P12]